MVEARLQVIAGGAVPQEPLTRDPWQFQTMCVDAFVASWWARGFSPVTIDNDIGLLERTLAALGRPAWEVTPQDNDRVVGDLAVQGRKTSTRREYGQIFKGFHRFLQACKAAEVEAAFGVRLACRSMNSTPPAMSGRLAGPAAAYTRAGERVLLIHETEARDRQEVRTRSKGLCDVPDAVSRWAPLGGRITAGEAGPALHPRRVRWQPASQIRQSRPGLKAGAATVRP
ncbi:hypothetical protein GCM10010277_85170 [Streptomyces longisporoflavus]|uniref:hypothetical protein n=1 Tax=Streptomyces longisporoflavus TaxID=28044 RepID=UPI0019AFA52A|nr:hypothetical protein [Streptomyces longisporoflavus]GGV72375.1 hypothetical protein GCM10010277_85170 [Streptomyces longisporoflavus]